MSTTPTPKPRQTKADREYIIANLPEETRRVQVLTDQGNQQYKRPEDVDVDRDEIVLANDGTPVIMRGKPGRRPKTQLNALTPQIGEVVAAREAHMSQDAIVREVESSPEGERVLHTVMLGMAKEAASMEFERMEAARHGQDTSGVSAKRARVLKGMADTVLKKKSLDQGGIIDLESPAARALFAQMMETFKGSMKTAGCRSEVIETVFQNLSNSLDDGWKEDVRQRMREKLL